MKKLLLLAVIAGLTSCGAADIFISGRAGWPSPPPPEPEPERVYRNSRVIAGRSFIPPGHLPPPGACKIWRPGSPPGHQPLPGSCDEAYYYVRPGEMIVRRDPYDKNLIEVSKAFVYRNRLEFDVEYYAVR